MELVRPKDSFFVGLDTFCRLLLTVGLGGKVGKELEELGLWLDPPRLNSWPRSMTSKMTTEIPDRTLCGKKPMQSNRLD